jgi:hypothetical protein
MRAPSAPRHAHPLLLLLGSALGLALAACSASGPANSFSAGGSSSATGDGSGGDIGLGGGPAATSTGTGGMVATCNPGGPGDDVDGDGFTPSQGDCDDCDPFSNPNAVEVIAADGSAPKDENCDGTIDEAPQAPCDQGIDVADLDPMQVPRAVELCKLSTGPKDWGVVSSTWVLADGAAPTDLQLPNFHLGHGFLSAFGANVTVRAGKRMLGLSSGSARAPTDPGYHDVSGFDKGYSGNSPPGFPEESPSCPAVVTGEPHDIAAVEVKLRVPSNAHGFSFDFDFFTYEWPNYICSHYNDFFIALLSPPPPGQVDGNISFDSMGNPVSVNNAFLDVCGCPNMGSGPCSAGGGTVFDCALGDADLLGTGFGFDTSADDLNYDHGSTGWLQTQAPVDPGQEISVRWAVYDSGDGALDTTTLIDNWKWLATPGITVITSSIPK